MKKLIYIFASLILTITMQAQDRPQPVPGPSPAIKINKPVTFTLKNGLKVLVVENHKLPRVSYNLTIDNLPYSELDKKGVSDITGSLIGSGTKTLSKDAFNEEVDFMGANINFWSSGAYASGLSKYSKRILDMMADGALNTVFTEEEFQKEKAKLIEGLKADEKSVPSVAQRLQSALTYGKTHPKGEFTTEATVNNITLNDVIENFNTQFVPENAYLVITGDVKTKDVKKWVTKAFEKWAAKPAPKVAYTEPTDVAKTEINFIDMPNAAQTELALINLADLKMTDPDYFAVIVANQILGGDFNSYLNMNLREKNAWTYGARTAISGSKYLSDFAATTQVRNTVTDSAIVESLKEIKRIKDELVSEETLKNVKAGYVGKFVMQVEKPQTIANYALKIKTQNLPEDFYENYLKNINAVTAEDVKRVANKYFKDGNLRIVVVSKALDVLPALEKLNIPIKYFDKYGNATDKPKLSKPVPAGVTAKTVLENYIKAIGGMDAINKVQTTYSIGSTKIPQAPAPLSFTSKSDEKKGKSMVELAMGGMSLMKQVVTADKGYMMQQGQRMELEGEKLAEAKEGMGSFAEVKMLAKNLSLKNIENMDGVDAYALVDGKTTHYYAVESGLKIAEVEEQEMQGQKMSLPTYYKDYREVKGVKYPFNIVKNVGIELDIKLTEVKVNEGVTDADFQ